MTLKELSKRIDALLKLPEAADLEVITRGDQTAIITGVVLIDLEHKEVELSWEPKR